MRRGYTYLEMLLVVALFLVGLSLAGSDLQPTRSKAAAEGGALRLAVALNAAREQAVSLGVPVGVALPTQGASQPNTDWFYTLQGVVQPRITSVVELAKECPGVQYFCGYWTPDGGASLSFAPAALGRAGQRFDLSSWAPPQAQDSLFVFQPDRTVVSNQPQFEDAYHIVALTGLDFVAGTVAGQPSFKLEGARSPWTVTLFGTGDIAVRSGVRLGSTVPTLANTVPNVVPPGAPAIGGANQAPTVQVQVFPKPDPATLPPGIDATVRVDGYLTVMARAQDLDGDNLRCSWSATGHFSHAQPTPMKFDPRSGEWISYWTWVPPPNDPPNSNYTLTCQIDDGKGGIANGQVGLAGTIQSLSTQRLAFTGNLGGYGIYLLNPDGSDCGQLPITNPNHQVAQARFSPDGQTLAYCTFGAEEALYTVTRKPPYQTRLLLPHGALPGINCGLEFSPDGTKIYVTMENGTNTQLYAVPLANPTALIPYTPLIDVQRCGVYRPNIAVNSVDGSVVMREFSGDLVHVDTSTGVRSSVTLPSGLTAWQINNPSFSIDGHRLAWEKAGTGDLFYADYDPLLKTLGPPTQVPGVTGERVNWSPDGSVLVYNQGQELYRVNLDGSNNQHLLPSHPASWCDDITWSSR